VDSIFGMSNLQLPLELWKDDGSESQEPSQPVELTNSNNNNNSKHSIHFKWRALATIGRQWRLWPS
jgi:hypothetical protein